MPHFGQRSIIGCLRQSFGMAQTVLHHLLLHSYLIFLLLSSFVLQWHLFFNGICTSMAFTTTIQPLPPLSSSFSTTPTLLQSLPTSFLPLSFLPCIHLLTHIICYPVVEGFHQFFQQLSHGPNVSLTWPLGQMAPSNPRSSYSSPTKHLFENQCERGCCMK